MSTLYWITRIATLGEFLKIILIIGCIVIGFFLIICPLVVDTYDDLKSSSQAFIKKLLRPCLIVFIISLIGGLFIPSRKELLFIYGVGGTIDYIKGNPTTKQLPDKCINALDVWIDTWTEKTDSINSKK